MYLSANRSSPSVAKTLLIGTACVLLVAAACVVFYYRQPPSCAAQYAAIDADLKAANYCTTDADCEALGLGGQYIEFGCFHYVNKAADKQQFYTRIGAYDSKCDEMIDDCDRAPPASCVGKKCVALGSGSEP
jgi:hypothetical protein